MPGPLVAIGGALLAGATVAGGWGLTQILNHGSQAVRTGIGTSVGIAVMGSVQYAVMNLDNVIVAAANAPVNPDSLESLLRVVAGVSGPFVGGMAARAIGGGDSFINRMVAGATFGGFIGQNLSNSLVAAANDFAGLEAIIRNQGIINGYIGVIPNGIADLVGKASGFVGPALRSIAQYPSMHISALDQVPVIGNIAGNTNLGSLVGIVSYDWWPLIAAFGSVGAAWKATTGLVKTATTNTYVVDTLGYLGAYFVPKIGIPWLAGTVGANSPAVNMAGDAIGIGTSAIVGYWMSNRNTRGVRTTSGAEKRRLKFTVAAGTGIMAANFLDVHFGQYLAGLGNYVASVQPAMSQVKRWIPEIVGAAGGLLAEAYRQSYVVKDNVGNKFSWPIKYLTAAMLGYVGADITWGDPVRNIAGAAVVTGLPALVEGAYHGIRHLVSRRAHAPADTGAPALARGVAVAAS